MTKQQLLEQAAKYRNIGNVLPPNMPGQYNKAYYLETAARLEREAAGIEPEPETAPVLWPIIGPAAAAVASEPEPEPEPELFAVQTKVHSKLALEVLKDSRPNIHRAFAIWLVERGPNKMHLFADILQRWADATGNSERAVRRWIDAGDGIFWTIEQTGRGKELCFIGKNKVFAAYELNKPGKVMLVDTSRLTGKLQGLRACLQALWIDKDARWGSRATIRRLTGVSERAQLDYEQLNRQKKRAVYATDQHVAPGKARQQPNQYRAVSYPKYCKQTTRRYGLYTPENQCVKSGRKSVGVDKIDGRVLFDDAVGAVDKAKRLGKRGIVGNLFAVHTISKRGNVLVRTVPTITCVNA